MPGLRRPRAARPVGPKGRFTEVTSPEGVAAARRAGFARYEVCGGFDRRPLTQETDLMVTLAWAGE